MKKSDEPWYILRKNNDVKAFLYLKKENENEDYGDFEKPFSKKVRLKIGTFKIALSNLRLGERFIQIIIENAITNNIDEIYVTLFENDRSEINALKGLLTTWGFNFYTKKKSNGESIFVKNIGPYNENITLKENYPAIPCDKQYRFLPIFPEYHFRMFPDLVLKSEKNIPMCEIAVENALEKIYITREYPCNKAKAGDLLVIYRIGESDRNKNYSSCATGIAIFEKREEAKVETDFFKLCKNKTVFSDYELQNFYKKGYKYLIYMIYLRPLMHNVILEKLREKKILGYNEGPRILTPISREHYNEIIELSEV